VRATASGWPMAATLLEVAARWLGYGSGRYGEVAVPPNPICVRKLSSS